jgi:cytochrome c oxidase assembly protein subunit 15
MSKTLYRYAVFCAFATFCLIIAGALVTSTGSGLSVPTWPFAPHTLLPPLVGGVLFEYGHRMIAGTVILLTLILVFQLFKNHANNTLKKLGIAALVAIFLQALLGGITVLTGLPPVVSIAHAGLAQIFFCIMVVLAFLANPDLQNQENFFWEKTKLFFFLTLLTPIVLYVQILAGALVRHIGAALVIPDFPLVFGHLFPPPQNENFPVWVNFIHTRVGAIIAFLFVVWTGHLAMRSPSKSVKKIGAISLFLLAGQILLGMSILWSWRNVIPTTAHVVVGALLFVANVILAVEARLAFKIEESSRQLEYVKE